MTTGLEIPFDRVTYRNGQRLDARDLRDDHRDEERLRRLHVRYLHDTWGIALGFEVRRPREGTAVVVLPGYAVDELGRDLLLPESIQPPLPKVDGRVMLTVGYREDSAFRALSDLSALCFDDGLNPRQERAGFAWRRPEDVRFGPEVPLVQLTMANGRIVGSLDSRVRRYTQPFLRPHMGVGVTEEGQSGWRDWVEGTVDARQELGLELKVNTSEAGFIRTPLYFPLLQGDFSNAPDKPLFEPDLWPNGEPVFPLDSLGFVTGATADSFIYRILMVGQNPFARTVTAGEAERRRWRLTWLGLEVVRGCEPEPDLSRIFTLSGFRVFPLAGVVSGLREG